MLATRFLNFLRFGTVLSIPLWLYAVALTGLHNTAFLPVSLVAVGFANLFALDRVRRNDPALGSVLTVAMLYKVAFVALFVVILLQVYGNGDSMLYHYWATQYVGDFRDFGQFPPVLGSSGSEFIQAITASLYLVIGSSLAIGMLAYGLLGFWGSYYYLKAFRLLFPQRDERLVLALLFFYPSLAFWTSSIGKDALIFFMLGALTYRLALLLRDGSYRNVVAIAPPLLGVLLIRPHVALMFLIAAGSAQLVGHTHGRKNRFLIRIAIVLLFSGGIFLLMPLVQKHLFLEDLSLASATDFLEWQHQATSRGGSAIVGTQSLAARVVRAPLILIRPFPWEAHNLTAALAAIEGVLLFALVILRRRELAFNLRGAMRHAFVLFVILLMFEFCVAFSSISNFGILTRQRTMFLPFIFMLFSAPAQAHQQASPRPQARTVFSGQSKFSGRSKPSPATSRSLLEPR